MSSKEFGGFPGLFRPGIYLESPKPGDQVVASTPPPRCDLSTRCLACGGELVPEHAHYKCSKCHQRDSCCF